MEEDEVVYDPHPFFHYYGMLMHQQNMLQDNIRTGTYHDAITKNTDDFNGKSVLDVGTGTGILSLFAFKAGARKCYGVEISNMYKYANKLVKYNNADNVIEIIHGKVEEVKLPEKVDMIISEPMGVILIHERMLESYIIARDLFLKEGGKMFPTIGNIYINLFTDQLLYDCQYNKSLFWNNDCYYNVNLNCLLNDSLIDLFAQPVVGSFNSHILLSNDNVTHTINFEKDKVTDLHHIVIPYEFTINKPSLMHGFAFWFDVSFNGSNCNVILSTSPDSAATHWYQCRFLLTQPIGVNPDQVIKGTIDMKVNEHKSYDILIEGVLVNSPVHFSQLYHLNDQNYQLGSTYT